MLRCAHLDLLSTAMQPHLPLTMHEYEEWGDPADHQEWQAMARLCPYHNIGRRALSAQPAASSPVVLASCALQVCPGKAGPHTYACKLHMLSHSANAIIVGLLHCCMHMVFNQPLGHHVHACYVRKMHCVVNCAEHHDACQVLEPCVCTTWPLQDARVPVWGPAKWVARWNARANMEAAPAPKRRRWRDVLKWRAHDGPPASGRLQAALLRVHDDGGGHARQGSAQLAELAEELAFMMVAMQQRGSTE